MERKSFLNQAVISYISTPYYKRILTNVVKDVEEEIQKNETMQTKTQQKQKITIKTTTVKPTITTTTTSKPLKESNLTTTATAAIDMQSNLFTTSFIQVSSSTTTSRPTKTTTETSLYVDKDMNENIEEKDKMVSNSFAYVVALLSNKIDIKAFATKMPITKTTTTTTKLPATKATTTTEENSLTLRPTSVLNFSDFLPANTWRNASIATHKISTKRVAKVIIGQDYTTSRPTSAATSSLHSLVSTNTRASPGGGSFSCLVEVLEPQCECGWSSTTKIVGASGVAGINEFPSMAGVMTIKNQKIFCGATISKFWFFLIN